METVFINSEYITLGQFLKFKGLISNGSDAKIAVLERKITVNGVPENRRGRKIYPDDVVKIEKSVFLVKSKHENQENRAV